MLGGTPDQPGLYPGINSFVVEPEKKEVYHVPTGKVRLQGPDYKKLTSTRARMRTIPERRAPLYAEGRERLYDVIEDGAFDLYARPGTKRYLSDNDLAMYATMARERSTGFTLSKHKYQRPIYQRIGERLASMHVDFGNQKLAAIVRGITPLPSDTAAEMREQVEAGSVPSSGIMGSFVESKIKQAEEQELIHSLMSLAGQDVSGYEMAGTMVGVLGTGGAMYGNLAKRGLTKFLGKSNRHKVKSFVAQGAAEAGIDLIYNPDGYTMMMGLLTGEDQNRALSVMDAVLIGSAFNLTVDSWRVLTTLNPHDANIAIQRMVDRQTASDLKKLGVVARSGESSAASAREHVKHPSLEAKDTPSGKRTPEGAGASEELIEAETGVWWQVHELDQAIEKLEKALTPKTPGWEVKDPGIKRKQLARLKKLKALYEKDTSLLTIEEDMLSKQAAGLEIETTPNIQLDDALKAVDDALPEAQFLDVKELEKGAGALPQDVSRMTVRRSLKKFMQTGDPSDLDWNNLAVYLGFGAALGGGTAAVSDDDKKLAGFMMGFALPIGGKHRFRSWGTGAIRAGAKKYREYVPKSWLAKKASMWLVPFNAQLKRISERVWMEEGQHAMISGIQTAERLEKMSGFISHIKDYVRRGIITEEEKVEMYWSLRNGARVDVKKTASSSESIRRGWLRHGESRGDPASVSELLAVRKMDEFDVRVGDPELRGITRRYFEEYESVLREMGDILDNHGLINGKIEDYFPRSIKKGMHAKYLKDSGIAEDSRILNAIKEEEHALGRDLTLYEKTSLADIIIRTYGYTKSGGKPGFVAKRKFDVVPEHLEKYYDTFEESSLKYVTQVTDYIRTSEFMGVGLTKNRLRMIIDPEASKKAVQEAAEKAAVEAQSLPAGEAREAYVAEKVAAAKAFPKRKPARTPKIEGKYDYMESIGYKVHKWVEEGHVPAKAEKWLTELLHKRYATPNGRPMWAGLKELRDVSYMWSIGNPYSAITQITDTAITASLNSRGWMEGTVLTSAAKKLTRGELTYTLADFGFDSKKMHRLLVEFEDEARTTKWLRRNLTVVGFNYADVFGKEVLLDATYKELRAGALASVDSNQYKRLVSEYSGAYGEKDFDRFVEALKKNDKYDDNVMGAVYARLLEQHPMTKSAMPMIYAKHPNARVLYQLTSFTLKQVDLLRKRSLDQIAEGLVRGGEAGNQMIRDGFTDSLKYAVLFGGGTMGVNSFKDFLLGRETDMSQRGTNAALNLMGMHRVHVERARRWYKGDWRGMDFWERTWHAMGKSLTPPMIQMNIDIAGDVSAGISGELPKHEYYGKKLSLMGIETGIGDEWLPYSRAASWRYLPIFGRDIFWRIGLGSDWSEQRRLEGISTPPKIKGELPKAPRPKSPRPTP